MYLILALLLLGFFLSHHYIVVSRKDRKPPGPYRWPIIGNVRQMPVTHQWETFSEWAKTYGDITYLEVIGRPIAVINTVELANKLLDKKSAIYSDRPRLVMAGDLCKFNRYFPFRPYGNEWREQRKLVASALVKSMVPSYYPLQEAEARKLVLRLIDHPEELFPEVKLRIGSIIMQVNYGYTPTSASDPFLSLPIQSVDNFSKATEPGAWLVDVVPFLQYLPTWFPGTGFLQTADEWARMVDKASWTPYLWFKDNVANGKNLHPTLCSSILSTGPKSGDDEARLVYAVASVLGGGLDTCMSTTLSLFRFMSLYPEVQEKAQEELDRVVGKERRLPTIQDKDNLPFLRSVITEVMRLCPSLPLSLPHALIQDDVLDGGQYYLPKGTLILPNVWHMFRDPEVYPQPNRFNPDRYCGSQIEMDKVWSLLFGFGRRACPGIYFAEGTLFAFASTVLATCKVVPMKDANGKMMSREDGAKLTSGSIVFPEMFSCRLEARSQTAVELLEDGLSAL